MVFANDLTRTLDIVVRNAAVFTVDCYIPSMALVVLVVVTSVSGGALM